jgi:hypothetical protein
MKWLGIRATEKTHLKLLRKACRTDKDGTTTDNFHKGIKKYIPNARRVTAPSLYYLDLHLALGRACILGYDYMRDDGEEEGHFALCVGSNIAADGDRSYIMVNAVSNTNGIVLKPTEYICSEFDMIEMLTYENVNGEKAEGWFI